MYFILVFQHLLSHRSYNRPVPIAENSVVTVIFVQFLQQTKFDFRKHFIITRDHCIEIHNNFEIDDAIIKNETSFLRYDELEEIYALLPVKRAYKYSKSQIRLCDKLANEYHSYCNNFEILTDDFETATSLYNELLDSVKEDLNNISIIDLTSDQKPEIYDEEIHDIVAVRNENELEIFYTRKENKDNFLEAVMLSEFMKSISN